MRFDLISPVVFWLCVGTILYTYFGYPILLWLMAWGRADPPREPRATPSVTLLIAAHHEEGFIARKLENSFALDYPRDRLHLLVAVDGSDDRTADIVRGFAARGVELSYCPERRGKMAAINRALPLARGEVVVFSDANNLYEPGALRELVAPLQGPHVGAVTGAKVIAPGSSALGQSEGLYWKYESFIKRQETRLGTCTGVCGEILAVWRHLWEAPPDHVINDDFYLAMRLVKRGYRVVYAPGARSVEHASATALDEAARRARIVAGRYQALASAGKLLPWTRPLVVWQVVSHKFLRPLVPFAMIGALLANGTAMLWPASASGTASLLYLSPPVGSLLLAVQMGFYTLALVGHRVVGHGRGVLSKALYLPAFLVSSNLAALVGLFRFLTRRQSSAWQRARRADER